MRKALLCLGLMMLALVLPAHALEIEDRKLFAGAQATATLRVISTGDVELFAPLIEAFIASNPSVAVEYTTVGSSDLMQAVLDGSERFDVALSSAMDLQTKLVNDGFARTHRSPQTAALPPWARWRDQLFAFTQEPAAIILSKSAFEGAGLPRTRRELIEIVRADPDRFSGRIGTYDIRSSGLGFLFATQEARSADIFWRFSEVMGNLDVQLYCCSSQMINDVANGTLAVAYNVLGSYAAGRQEASAYTILYPEDFTLVMQRTALIPADALQPEIAGRFVDALVARRGAGELNSTDTEDRWFSDIQPGYRRIPVGPGLLVYLDKLKRRNFLDEWTSAVVKP